VGYSTRKYGNRQNSSFIAVKHQKMLFGHGMAVTMVPYVVFDVPKEY